MVLCHNDTNWQLGGPPRAMFELRHRRFFVEHGWRAGLLAYRGIEFDKYDTPAATYLVCRDEHGAIAGSVRLSPTDLPYMLQENWPEMCAKRPLPETAAAWEFTRFVVERSLSEEIRKSTKAELVAALFEYGLMNGIEEMIGVAPPIVWRRIFVEAGCALEYLGPERSIGTDICVAGLLRINAAQLAKVRMTTGITGPVLFRPNSDGGSHQGETA